jgi:hypothetical protein
VVAERYIRIGPVWKSVSIWSILKTNSADGIGKAGYRGREERKAAQAGYATFPGRGMRSDGGADRLCVPKIRFCNIW